MSVNTDKVNAALAKVTELQRAIKKTEEEYSNIFKLCVKKMKDMKYELRTHENELACINSELLDLQRESMGIRTETGVRAVARNEEEDIDDY